MTESDGRVVVNAHSTPFLLYDLEGPVQPEMSWLPVSFDRDTGEGCYLMRMEPATRLGRTTTRGPRAAVCSRSSSGAEPRLASFARPSK
jgi:hypothetical protein